MSIFQLISLLGKVEQLQNFADRYNETPLAKRQDFRKIPFDQKYCLLGTTWLFPKGIITHDIRCVAGLAPVWENMLNDIDDLPYSTVSAKYDSDLKLNYQDYLKENKFSDPNFVNMYKQDLVIMFNIFDEQTNEINQDPHEVADYATLANVIKELNESPIIYAKTNNKRNDNSDCF